MKKQRKLGSRRFWQMKFKRRLITETTHSTSVGPITLDVEMARRHGWSEKSIERVAKKIGTLSRVEGARSHRNGPVRGCPCLTCDTKIPTDELFEQPYLKTRRSWQRRGLWPNFPAAKINWNHP